MIGFKRAVKLFHKAAKEYKSIHHCDLPVSWSEHEDTRQVSVTVHARGPLVSHVVARLMLSPEEAEKLGRALIEASIPRCKCGRKVVPFTTVCDACLLIK